MRPAWWILACCSLARAAPLFHRDVAPILRGHCQGCHRASGIAPMPLTSFKEARPWAKAIAQAAATKKMPPWFAVEGRFANDPSLTPEQIETLVAWAKAGAPEGPPERDDATPGIPDWPPDAIVGMPKPFAIPRSGEIEYQYVIVPSGFTRDQWIQKMEIQPGNPAAVHHAVVYIREPGSPWLKGAPRGEPFSVPLSNPDSVTTSDILFIYAPGNARDEFPSGRAKLVPAGSDLVFQLHYTSLPKGGQDQTRIGLVFAKSPPAERVLTLQIGNDHFLIPPNVPDYRVAAFGTLPNKATLLSLWPHMHLRGSGFEFRVTPPGGSFEELAGTTDAAARVPVPVGGAAAPVPAFEELARTTEPAGPVRASQTLLRVKNYDFHWQLSYKLAVPLTLPAGTRMDVAGWFDNSRANPRNPDPNTAVRFGFQSSEEMMIGFFDVAVPANVDKNAYFVRP